MDVRRVEHVEDVVVDAIELEQLLIARQTRAALGFLTRVVLTATATGDIRLRTVDDLATTLGATDRREPCELLDVGASELADRPPSELEEIFGDVLIEAFRARFA